MYIEPICPTEEAIFVVEQLVMSPLKAGRRPRISGRWMKLGASFFQEEAETVKDGYKSLAEANNAPTQVRVRKYVPA